MTCKDCIHYEPCFEYGNMLDPIHGGVICDSFKDKTNFVEVVRCEDCQYFISKENLTDEYDNPLGYDGLCDNIDKYTDMNDFCSCGKRKTE